MGTIEDHGIFYTPLYPLFLEEKAQYSINSRVQVEYLNPMEKHNVKINLECNEPDGLPS